MVVDIVGRTLFIDRKSMQKSHDFGLNVDQLIRVHLGHDC